MSKPNRSERCADYQRASRKADDLVSTGRNDEARGVLEAEAAAAASNGDEDYHHFFIAESYGLAGDWSQACQELDRGLRWAGDHHGGPDFFLLRQRGNDAGLAGQLDAAIEWFDKALAVNPQDANAMRDKGASLSEKGQKEAAIEWFDKALAVNPKDAAAMCQRGVSLSKKGQEEAAIEWFDKALAVNPKDADAMRQKGVSLSKKGQEEAAIEWFDKALAGESQGRPCDA